MGVIKKVFAVLFAVIAVLLLNTAVYADVTEYDLRVCETKVTSANASDILGDGVFNYDSNTNTLTISGNISPEFENSYDAVIHNDIDGLTIKIASDSVIELKQGNFLDFGRDTTVTGPGKLTFKGKYSYYKTTGFDYVGVNIGGVISYPKLTLKDIDMEMDVFYGFYGRQGEDIDLKLINSRISVEAKYDLFRNISKLEFVNCDVTSPDGAIVESANVYESDGLTPAKSVVISPKSNYSFVSDSTAYNLRVAGVEVWSKNAADILGDGKVKYVPEENVLYLYGDINTNGYGIISKIEDLTINVVNDCSINTKNSYGIYCEENTTITGGGTLTISSSDEHSLGIYFLHNKILNIENANIIINSSDGISSDGGYKANLNINNSYIDITSTVKSALDLARVYNNAAININGCGITTPVNAVIKNSRVYEKDGQTLAQRVVIEPCYTVTFDANGGSGSMEPVNIGKDSVLPYKLPECDFTPPTDADYIFECWLINGKSYSAGEYITLKSDVTARAQWKRRYKVTYYSNNGKDQTKENIYDHIVDIRLAEFKDCNFTKPAYKEFDCWEIDGVRYAAGKTINVNRDIDVYAVYKDRLYAVTFDTAGLCTPPETQYLPYNGIVADPGEPYAEGYVFNGWFKSSDYDYIGKMDFANYPYTVKSDVTFYACFKEAVNDTVEVTGFDTGIHSGMSYYKASDYLSVPNGANYRVGGIEWHAVDGSWDNSFYTDGRVSFTAGKDYYAKIYVLPLNNYDFGDLTVSNRLAKLNDGTELIDMENSEFSSTKIVIRTTPVKAGGSCTISYMANGGTGDMGYVRVAQGSGFILPECSFTAPEGKYFIGWRNGYEGEMLDVGDTLVPSTGNIWLYAQWADKGDINADGVTDKKDAAYLLKYISGTCSLTEGQLEMARMTADEDVDMLDVVAILKTAS